MIYQTAFLLDAGAERAIDQLRKSTDYQGETWKPAFAYVADLSQQNGTQPNPSQSNNDCTIEIRITRNDPTGTKENVTVDVIARIEPSEFSLYPVQQSRQFEYKFPKN